VKKGITRGERERGKGGIGRISSGKEGALRWWKVGGRGGLYSFGVRETCKNESEGVTQRRYLTCFLLVDIAWGTWGGGRES